MLFGGKMFKRKSWNINLKAATTMVNNYDLYNWYLSLFVQKNWDAFASSHLLLHYCTTALAAESVDNTMRRRRRKRRKKILGFELNSHRLRIILSLDNHGQSRHIQQQLRDVFGQLELLGDFDRRDLRMISTKPFKQTNKIRCKQKRILNKFMSI